MSLHFQSYSQTVLLNCPSSKEYRNGLGARRTIQKLFDYTTPRLISTTWGRECISIWTPNRSLTHTVTVPKAEKAFLDGLPKKEAARIAGSRDKLQWVLEGETVETIYNEGKDPLYQWRRVGKLGQNTPTKATKTRVDVSNAYEVAKAGGKHAGYLKQYASLPDHLVEKAVRGFEKQITMHKSWIENLFLKLPLNYPPNDTEILVKKKMAF